jgi:hypothetical protein
VNRSILGGVAVLVSAVLLCGCATEHRSKTATTGSSTTTSDAIPSTTTSSAVEAAACSSSQLKVEIGRTGTAAGSIEAVVSFENTSSAACTLDGYPNVQMVGSAGQSIATEVTHGISYTVPSVPVQVVTLAPGAQASFDLGFSDSTRYGTASCPTSTRVEITPPDSSQSITVAWQIAPYGGATIAQLQCGQITVSPVFAGSGALGSP